MHMYIEIDTNRDECIHVDMDVSMDVNMDVDVEIT